MSEHRYKVLMPDGVRKYKVLMPDGVRKYKVSMPDLCIPVVCESPNYFTSPNDFTTWLIQSGSPTVTPDVSKSPDCTQNADRIVFTTPNIDELACPILTVTPGLLEIRLWIRRVAWAAGTELRVTSGTGSPDGNWVVDMDHSSFSGGAWQQLSDVHPAVTVDFPFLSPSASFSFYLESRNNGLTIDAWCAYAQPK